MKKLLAASAAVLVAVGLGACSEAPYRDGGSASPAPAAPAAPAQPASPAAPAIPGVPAIPGLDELMQAGDISPADLLELQRQMEELGIDPNDPSSWGLSEDDLAELERQMGELEDLLGSGSMPAVGGLNSDADVYGDDPALDALWDDCAAGDMAACDELYWSSPVGSDYEDFGENCGTAGLPADQIFCDQ